MTSGYMNCPKCRESFQYMRWEKKGLFLVEVEIPEPWECPKCKSLIITEEPFTKPVAMKVLLEDFPERIRQLFEPPPDSSSKIEGLITFIEWLRDEELVAQDDWDEHCEVKFQALKATHGKEKEGC